MVNLMLSPRQCEISKLEGELLPRNELRRALAEHAPLS
jgi:hypothetical protein